MLVPLWVAAAPPDDLLSRFSIDATTDSSPGRPAGSPFIWQPLPLRATFRPLNRHSTSALPAAGAEQPPQPPQPPRPPRPPRPPSPPEALALTINERSISADSSSENSFGPAAPASRFSSADNPFLSSFFQPQPTPPAPPSPPSPSPSLPAPAAVASSTPSPWSLETGGEDDELPTRQPMARFRPTRAPAEDEDAGGRAPPAALAAEPAGPANASSRAISQECFECICEASTNCNGQSRCQTSDVRHTRCGLFLISYDQWLATGLSRELVSREALARDAAADERAFYECVTKRDCAERLLTVYMQRNQKDCDRDGRIDCYDMAAIHHSGTEKCASESLLDSQYWSDFNACLGFGR